MLAGDSVARLESKQARAALPDLESPWCSREPRTLVLHDAESVSLGRLKVVNCDVRSEHDVVTVVENVAAKVLHFARPLGSRRCPE
jgi:hypothetical protein